mgnify:FL=1|jgi:dGTPase
MHSDKIRMRLEGLEDTFLSPNASRSSNTRGRLIEEPKSFMRTEYMRDRDRIIHSKAFRRLKHKTQVFIRPVGDHFVTRLTHTIEVSQIARSISRALSLNEDLTEAIALGHDLGHTPFGHLGEEFLNDKIQGGYNHAGQSLRVVDKLEKNGLGLNLTWEVRQGILYHSKGRGSLAPIKAGEEDLSLEAQVCRLSDAIAYVNHDLSDAIRANVLTEDDIPDAVLKILGQRHSERVNNIIFDVVKNSENATRLEKTSETQNSGDEIRMGERINKAVVELREFLFDKVYFHAGKGEDGVKALRTLDLLWQKFKDNPNLIPDGYVDRDDPVERQMADYISGMTDDFAFATAKNWHSRLELSGEIQ